MKKYALIYCLMGIMTFWSGCKSDDPCDSIACLNGGTCIEGECICQGGFEGETCETNTLQGFLGTYSVKYMGCFTTTENHEILVDRVDDRIDQILLFELGDYACPEGELVVTGGIENSSLVIAEQTIDCGPIEYTFDGSGTLTGDTLTIDFTVTYDADGIMREDNCTAVLDK